jgi:hypothetical protein
LEFKGVVSLNGVARGLLKEVFIEDAASFIKIYCSELGIRDPVVVTWLEGIGARLVFIGK